MHLRLSGYEVLSAPDGPAGFRLLGTEKVDLVLLDLMLPGMDGMEFCSRLRKDPVFADIPVIMLTAKSQEGDKVAGLGVGADDYITKPFGLRELTARIEVALRHADRLAEGQASRRNAEIRQHPGQRVLDLEIDTGARVVRKSGLVLPLSPTEFELLTILMQHRGQVVDRVTLAGTLGLSGQDSGARSLDVHVLNLRRKLGDNPARTPYIATVRGLGYRFDA